MVPSLIPCSIAAFMPASAMPLPISESTMQPVQISMIFFRLCLVPFIHPQMNAHRLHSTPRIPIRGFSFWNILISTITQHTREPRPATPNSRYPIIVIFVVG